MNMMKTKFALPFLLTGVLGVEISGYAQMQQKVEEYVSANTELFSKGASDGLKAMTFPQIREDSVSEIGRKQLHNNLMKFASNDEEVESLSNYEKELYKNYGPYVAASIIQVLLDFNAFIAYANADMETIRRISPDIADNLEKSPAYKGMDKDKKDNYIQTLQDVIDYFCNKLEESSAGEELSERATFDSICAFYKDIGMPDDDLRVVKRVALWKSGNTSDERVARMAYLSHTSFGVVVCYLVGKNDDHLDNLMQALSPETKIEKIF